MQLKTPQDDTQERRRKQWSEAIRRWREAKETHHGILDQARQLAGRGLGWEDICVDLEAPQWVEPLVRRMVLNRTWRGALK